MREACRPMEVASLPNLELLEAWIRHWLDDSRCGLAPTDRSLREALEIVGALKSAPLPSSPHIMEKK